MRSENVLQYESVKMEDRNCKFKLEDWKTLKNTYKSQAIDLSFDFNHGLEERKQNLLIDLRYHSESSSQ